MTRPRLVWHSNSPTAPTGYGVQTALFTPLLNESYEVAISTFYGLEGSPVKWKGMPLLPGLGGNFGAEYLPLHAARWGRGDPRNVLTMTLMDVWVLPPPMVEALGGLLCWTPIDHDPAPPQVKAFFAESGAIPMAMSRFGQEELSAWGSLYCPHAVDASVYKPTPRDKARDEEISGFPKDAFLVGWVGANKGRPSRKGFQFGLEAFARFRKRHENAFLYLHTSLRYEWMQGENLEALIMALDVPQESLIWADQYALHFDPYPAARMARVYSTFDVLMNPTMGGGFEICNLEAAACGVPAITTQFTAMPESSGPTPWKVPGQRFWTGQNSWNLAADVDAIDAALEEAYTMTPKQRRALSKRMRRHGEKFDVHRVFEEHMLPSVKKAEKRIRNRGKGIDVTEGLTDSFQERKLLDAEEGPTISVVTPWQNHPELGLEYWKALDGEKTHEVIIVDNGSDPRWTVDETVKNTSVHVIRLTENSGFCHANNLGLEKATGDAVLFLNNDIALGIPGWLEAIRSELKPGVLVGANVRADPHTQVDGTTHPYLDGWCLAGMKEDLEKLGGWDEGMEEPAYFSDNELCLRAKKAGMLLTAVNPPLTHLLNRTAGPPEGHVAEVTRRNYARFAQKVREEEPVAA